MHRKLWAVYSSLALSLTLAAPSAHAIEFSNKLFGKTLTNIGLVVNNPHYTIYRSTMLGNIGMPMFERHLKKQDLPFPKTVIYMNKNGYEGKIPWYGTGALEEYKMQDKFGFDFFHSFDYAYRTYVDGHDPYHPGDDIDAQDRLGPEAKELFGEISDNKVDGDVDALVRVMHLVLDPDRQPVLFHCLGGRHRTGMVGLIIRYLQGGDWLEGSHKVVIKYEDHLTEKKMKGSFTLNNAQYEYYLHNKTLFRPENLDFVEKFTSDDRYKQLKTLYMDMLNET